MQHTFINQLIRIPHIIKKINLENGAVYIEYDNGLITLEEPIEYFQPTYNRYMTRREYDYLEKKKFNDRLLEKLPSKQSEKVKKI